MLQVRGDASGRRGTFWAGFSFGLWVARAGFVPKPAFVIGYTRVVARGLKLRARTGSLGVLGGIVYIDSSPDPAPP